MPESSANIAKIAAYRRSTGGEFVQNVNGRQCADVLKVSGRAAGAVQPNRSQIQKGIGNMKKFTLLTAMTIVALSSGILSGSAFAQTGTALKESGMAVAEKAKEGKETVQAAVVSEPKKSVHKTRAKAHHAKSLAHDTKAKAAGDQIGK